MIILIRSVCAKSEIVFSKSRKYLLATTNESALSTLSDQAYDVVLLDLGLPKKD
ncbi:hypothetical protein [Rhodoferax antarcticus]|uniref:Uncharacterized protein n=1 Tax=Rhodoferax antarcticus ANT.BR TaxID=1111071 RepID=A0A1Q8YG80_9BURK|nr:hypothetical protein [Rhodoferax antarcticus]OLP07048.1 hypothetical protein BLL52_1799 [Rhodoferax antarcticus ANT.BR]